MITLDRWESWLNPILVRSLRQSLRSRAFVGTYLLVLLIAASVSVLAALAGGGRGNDGMGHGLFITTVVVWTFAAWLVQGQLAFLSVARERNENTWDLVELTGMRPWSVAWGLAATTLVQAGVIGSALAPFLVLSYLLRGVEIGTLLLALLFIPLGSVLCSALAVFLGCLGNHKALRSTLGGLLGIGLIILCISSITFWASAADFLARELARDWDGWLAMGIAINAVITGALLLLVLAATLLTHPAQDRSSRGRITWFLIWINAIACWLLVVLWAVWRHPGDVWDILGEGGIGLTIAGLIWVLVFGVFACTEPDGLTHRQRQSVKEGGRLRRLVMAVAGPGCWRGRRATLLMFVAALIPLVPTWVGVSTTRSFQTHGLSFIAAFVCYALFYLGVIEPALRRLLPQVLGNAALRRTALFASVAVWIAVSTVAIGLGSDWDFSGRNLLTALAPHFAVAQLAGTPGDWKSIIGIAAFVHGLLGLGGLILFSFPGHESELVLSADRSMRDE